MGELKMPSLGAEMEAGRLVEWKVKPGDSFHRGDVVAVVDTDKAAVDVEIWEDGVIEELRVPVGDKVPVGTVIATYRQTAAVGAHVIPPERLAAPMRTAIAAAMSKSKREIPHYYLSHSIDLGQAMEWLSQENAKLPLPERILLPVVFFKAVGLALQESSELNGIYVDGVYHPSSTVHLGIAIRLKDGLVAPAIHDVNQKSLSTLMRDLNDLVTRAKAGSLRSSELMDSTCTVSHLGDQGVETVFGVIYPPQVAIVGIGGVFQMPWVVNGQIQSRPIVRVVLSADHRVSDGQQGGFFLNRLAHLLQEPGKL